METQLDEARIERIARAMCRAARKNPDDRMIDGDGAKAVMPTAFSATSMTVPVWMQFRDSAVRFVAAHAKVAEQL